MLRVILRNIAARKLRMLLSALAVVLGVAFVAGSFIVTDSMGRAFDGIVTGSTAEALVTPDGYEDVVNDSGVVSAPTMPASTVDTLGVLPEVAAADGNVEAQGVFVISKSGELVGGNGPPSFAFNFTDTVAISGNRILSLVDGELPRGVDEIALDVDTADKGDYRIGDEVTLATRGSQPIIRARLTGVVRFGSESGLVGATLTIFDTDAMQALFFDGRDVYTSIALTAADEVSQEELRDAAAAALPGDLVVETGDAVVEEQTAGIEEMLGFVNIFLLVFAGVSLVVGAFLIVNTFSILITQRARELALLRAIGASRGQVNRAVITEAIVMGVLASAVGVGVGYLLAVGLKAGFTLVGIDMGNTAMPLGLRTVLVSFLLGTLLSAAAAYLPARRAARVSIVEGMVGQDALAGASSRTTGLWGALALVGGMTLLVVELTRDDGEILVIGSAMVAILLGVTLNAALIGRPVVRAVGVVYQRLFGEVGTLSTQNALRNPRRTAATASALMVGLALVSLVAVLGQSAKVSTDQAIESSLSADLVVSSVTQQAFSPAYAERIRSVSGVDSVAVVRTAMATLGRTTVSVVAVDPAVFATAVDVRFDRGSLADVRDRRIVLSSGAAAEHGLSIGDEVNIGVNDKVVKFRVGGLYAGTGAVSSDVLMSLRQLSAAGGDAADTILFVLAEESASEVDVRAGIEGVLAGDPTVNLQDQDEYADQQRAAINQFLYLIYALLALAVVIAVLGVTNTLALSAVERTREIGLLRALGMGRRQLRTMVRLESIAIALLGAVLGLVTGVGFGAVLQSVATELGVDVLSVPWLQLSALLVLAVGVGVLAAAIPARRAGKMNILTAISTD